LFQRPRIPFRPPFSAATVGVVAVAWGPATSLFVRAVDPGDWRSLLLHAPWPIAYWIVGRSVFSASSIWTATLRLGVALAVTMTILAPLTPAWAGRSITTIAGTALATVLIAHTYALLLVGPLWKCVRSGSHEDVDRAQVYAAPWVALPAALHPTADLSTVLLLLPLAPALGAMFRIRARRRWLADVRAGKDPRWRLLEGQLAPTLPAILRASGPAWDCVLAVVHEADAPFRDAQRLEVVARVPLLCCRSSSSSCSSGRCSGTGGGRWARRCF
jgi:hypothetical protein